MPTRGHQWLSWTYPRYLQRQTMGLWAGAMRRSLRPQRLLPRPHSLHVTATEKLFRLFLFSGATFRALAQAALSVGVEEVAAGIVL